MQINVYNKKQLDVAVNDMYNQLAQHKELSLEYGKPFKDKTLRQLGFFFSALAGSVKQHFDDLGDEYTLDNIKENFYNGVAHIDDRFVVEEKMFNGTARQRPMRLSEMDRSSVSRFIDRCLWIIDNAKPFKDLVLHPSIRYTWIRHLDTDTRWYDTLPVARNDPEYLAHVRTQACLWCGISNKSEAHHIRLHGLGGTAYKPDDTFVVPLCHMCHHELHNNGAQAFYDDCAWITKYVDLLTFGKLVYNKWKNKT